MLILPIISVMLDLFAVHHKCSLQNPCPYGGVCEAIGSIYKCNCTGTDQYGPLCGTGTKYSNI